MSQVDEAQSAYSSGIWSKAESLLLPLTKASPEKAEWWSELGVALYRQGKYETAIDACLKAERLGFFPDRQAMRIARSYAQLGQTEQALVAIERALKEKAPITDEVRSDKDFAKIAGNPKFKGLLGIAERPKSMTAADWRADIAYLKRELERLHVDLYAHTSKKDLDACFAQLDKDLVHLSYDGVIVRLKQLIATVQNGHTRLEYMGYHMYPIELYAFQEGVYVLGTDSPNADLLGLKLTRVGGLRLEEVWKRVASMIPSENRYGLLWQVPFALRFAEALHELGVSKSSEQCEFTFEAVDGREVSRVLKPGAFMMPLDHRYQRSETPVTDARPNEQFWSKFLPDGTAYMQLNQIGDSPTQTLDSFCEGLFREMDTKGCDRFVLDIRSNGGGDNFLNVAIVQRIIQRPKLNKRGHFFVIIGRRTFSAAMSLAGNLDRDTNVVFVGEPTGTSPNHAGESTSFQLPRSGLRGSVATLYWMNTYAQDKRTWLAPELPAYPTWADWSKGRDPAMEAIAGSR